MPLFFSIHLIWKFTNTGEGEANQGLHLLTMERAEGEATQGLRLLVIKRAETGGITLNLGLLYAAVVPSAMLVDCAC